MNEPMVKPSSCVARINVTPIIDVALVLVIILLITAPMIAASDVDVELPTAQTQSVEDDVRLNVTLGRDGAITVDADAVAPSQVAATIRAQLDAHGDGTLVVVRADEAASYDAVEAVIKQAREAGAKRLAIATRQKGQRPWASSR